MKRNSRKQSATKKEPGIVRSSLEACLIVDSRGGRIRFANAAMARMVGRSVQQLEKKTLNLILSPSGTRVVQERLRRRASRHPRVIRQLAILHKDGTSILVVIRARAARFQGKSCWILAFHRCSQSAEHHTPRVRDFHERIMQTMDGMFRLSRHVDGADFFGEPMEITGKVREVTGWEADDFMKKPDLWSRMIHPDDLPLYQQVSRECLTYLIPCTRSYRTYHHARLEYRNLEDKVFLDRNPDGTVWSFVITQDVTERKDMEERLRQSEARFFSAFYSCPDAIVISRMHDGRVVEVNEGFSRISGYAREEVIGRSSLELGVWEDPGNRARFVSQMQRDGRVRDLEYRYRTKSGTIIEATLSADLITINGEMHFLSVVRDLTDRRQMEEKLRYSQELLQTALVQSPAGILIARAPDLMIEVANPAALRMRGGDPQESLAIEVPFHSLRWQTFHSDGTPYPPEELSLPRAVLRGEVTNGEEFIIRDGNGVDRWVSANSAPVRRPDGEVVGGMVILHDITDRVRAEQLFRELSQTLNERGDVMFMTSQDGTILWINSQFTELYGYESEEVVGKTTPRILRSGEQSPELYERFWQTIQNGGSFRSEFINRTRNGRLVHVEQTVAPLLEFDKSNRGFLSLQRDVTGRKAAEKTCRENELRYRTLVETQTEFIVRFLPDSTFTFVNDSYCAFCGFRREDILGKKYLEIMPERSRQDSMVFINSVLQNGECVIEHAYPVRDRICWIRWHGKPILDVDGTVREIHAVGLDITDRKLAEEGLKKALAEKKQ